MDLTYVKKVQEWVELDNKVLKNKEQIKDVVEKKKCLEDDIIHYIEESKFDNLNLSISDGNIRFSKKTSTQPLSIKTLKVLLDKYQAEHKTSVNVDEICDYIVANLEKKTTMFMKRDIK
jgi:hypothetical protein